MAEEYRWPYTPTPGGSMPPAGTHPDEGRQELRSFFWLSILNTVIISVVGIAAWMIIH